ncbi:hypothetical protein ANO11243_055780 [Dothideomycetidae sp. 11243]|nr:hypothetical protein ANO11243_055780 [fungal sp. No.11243]
MDVDMGGMNMGGMNMGGMDMGSSTGMFLATNLHIAKTYWFLIATFVAALGLRRVAVVLAEHLLSRSSHGRTNVRTSRPTGPVSQFVATTTAVLRELSYPQPWHATGKFARNFNPPPLGDCLIIGLYWVVVLCMLWSNVIVSPDSDLYAYKWEIVGYRAAWVSVTQLPFIYLLSCKISPITLICGISAERLNVFHRWAARTIFLTVVVHWSFFFTEWDLAKIVRLEIQYMPMVKYGFGAWAVIGWMILSGCGFFRQQAYEVFVMQHIAAAAVLLWLVWVHVPSYASYNVWMAVAFLGFDWASRMIWAVWINIHIPTRGSKLAAARPIVGYSADAVAVGDDCISLSIRAVDFPWKPGQFICLQVPRLGLGQNHPFSILSVPSRDDESVARLFIKAQSGLTRQLRRRVELHPDHPTRLQVFVSGPWGSPPSLTNHDTIVFVATSTGISFTLPLFRKACSTSTAATRVVHFHWIIRDPSLLQHFQDDLERALLVAASQNLHATVTIHLTRIGYAGHSRIESVDSMGSSSSSDTDSFMDANAPLTRGRIHSEKHDVEVQSQVAGRHGVRISHQIGRPSLDTLLRRPIEKARGETAIIGCGGHAFPSELRNYVSRISDERAVHKGTGAQGIYLHIENYST